MNSRVIITAAITGGIHVPSQTQYLPITPKQIADEAILAWKAGAAVAHIHARNPETGEPSSDLKLYGEIVSRIKDESDMVLCITTGGALGMPLEQRIAVVPNFKPELASFNAGSLNFGLYPTSLKIKEFRFPWEKQYLEMTEGIVFANTFKDLKYFCNVMNEYQTKPEIEIYDAGQINNTAHLIKEGVLKPPVYLQFVMGVLGGIPATVKNLIYLVESARDALGDFQWSVCAVGKNELPLGAVALALGGHVRVGLEDNVYLEKGRLAKSNAELVQRIVGISQNLGLATATPSEAREILGLNKGNESLN